MRIRLVIAVCVVAALLTPFAKTHAATAAAEPPSGPELGALVSGTTQYVSGALVWTDYAYDDRGRNTSPAAEGSASYPSPSEPNSADLIQLQLAPTDAGTRVTAILETLVDPSLPLLGVGFDTDGNATTGAPGTPGGAWRVKGRLGLDRFLSVDSTGATWWKWTGTAWAVAATFPAAVDPGRNTMTATIPSRLLPTIGAAPWSVVGLLGLTRPSWLRGGPVYDLAFVGGEAVSGWQDARQADILSGNIAAADAEVTVDTVAVRSRATHTPPIGPGYHTFLYHSALRLPEGTEPVSIEGANSLYYLGPYQPYLVWLPSRPLPSPAPLLVMLHGALENEMQPAFAGGPPPSGAYALFLGNTTFDVPAVVVTPLGRSETDYYWGIGEQDVLDVIHDAEHRFVIDPNRVVMSGISLGSQGSWRLAELHPDLFSAIVPMIAPSTFPLEQVVGPLRHIFPNAFENVGNLPQRVLAGRLDPLSDGIALDGQDTDFVQAVQHGDDMEYWSLLLRHHQVVPAAENCVLLQALGYRRNADPAHVIYTTEPDLEMSDPATGLDLRYRSAYWITDIEARTSVTAPAGFLSQTLDNPALEATVDVTSLARSDRVPTSSLRPPAFGQNIVTPGDVCGAPGSTVRTLDAWYMLRNAVAPGPPQPVSNGLQLTLKNVAATTLSLAGARLSVSRPIQLVVTGDGPATVTLTGSWGGPVRVTRDAEPVGSVVPDNGQVAIGSNFQGTHTMVLTPS